MNATELTTVNIALTQSHQLPTTIYQTGIVDCYICTKFHSNYYYKNVNRWM